MDFDSNEIIAKASPTTLAPIHIVGSTINWWVDDTNVLIAGTDTANTGTKFFLKSIETYKRIYSSSANMCITSNGVFGRATSSSRRYKKDITIVSDETLDPYKILNIPVMQYKYNEENVPIDKKLDDLYVGLIAEDVAKEYPIAAEYNEDGQIETWNVKVIVPAMLKIIQDQQKEIEALKAEIINMKNK